MTVDTQPTILPTPLATEVCPSMVKYCRCMSSIEREWNDIAAEWESLPAATPMQTSTWARAAARAFSKGQVKLVVARGSGVVAVAPLFQPAGAEVMTVLGAELFEITDFSYRDAHAAELLAREVLKLNTPIFLRSVQAGSPLLQAFRKMCPRRRIMITRPAPGSPWIPLDESWKEPESHLNSGRRSDLRRARRRAESLGHVHIEFIRPKIEELSKLLEIAFGVESANWKGRIHSSLQTDAEVGNFYRYYAEEACRSGKLHLGYLWIGDQPAAMQLAVEHNNSFWLLKMGFDEKFRRCSPGTLLMVESIRYAAEHGWAQYAILGVCESWNQVWTQLTDNRISLRIYAAGLPGLLSAVRDGVLYLVRHHTAPDKAVQVVRTAASCLCLAASR
jgi:CelD/BcsL family acetyltransferase involved in cellulose biosynthesis